MWKTRAGGGWGRSRGRGGKAAAIKDGVRGGQGSQGHSSGAGPELRGSVAGRSHSPFSVTGHEEFGGGGGSGRRGGRPLDKSVVLDHEEHCNQARHCVLS